MVGVAVGAVAHHRWIKRQGWKTGSYSPEKPVKPVGGANSQPLYAHLESGTNKQVFYEHLHGSKVVAKGEIPTFENAAYGSIPNSKASGRGITDSGRGLSLSGRGSSDGGDNTYVRDPMEDQDTHPQDIRTTGNVSYRTTRSHQDAEGEGQEIYTTVANPEGGVATDGSKHQDAEGIYSDISPTAQDAYTSKNAAYQTSQTSLTASGGPGIATRKTRSATGKKDAENGRTSNDKLSTSLAGKTSKTSLTSSPVQAGIATEENVAYSIRADSSLKEDYLDDYTPADDLSENTAYQTSQTSLTGSLGRDGVVTENNVAYKSTSKDEDLYDYTSTDGLDNSAYHTGKTGLTRSPSIVTDGNIAYQPTAHTASDEDLYEYTTTSNSGRQTSLTGSAGQDGITTGDNVAYKSTANSLATDEDLYEYTENGAYNSSKKLTATQHQEIAVEENVAYHTQRRDQQEEIAVEENVAYHTQRRDQQQEIAVEENVAYHTQRRDQKQEIAVEENVAYHTQRRDQQQEIAVEENVAYHTQRRDQQQDLRSTAPAVGVAYSERGVAKKREIPLKENIAYKRHYEK